MNQLPEYVTPQYLENLCLQEGKGDGTEGHRCAIQEVRAWLTLDAASDAVPECVCPVIGRLIIGLNDISAAHRKALVPLLPRLVGSKAELAVTIRRAFAVADWAVRVVAADALRSAKLEAEAEKLAALAPIVDETTSYAASYAASDASDASRAASYASYAASYASRAASDASRAASYASDASDASRAASDASRAASYASDASRAASRAASDASYAASDASDASRAADLIVSLLAIQ